MNRIFLNPLLWIFVLALFLRIYQLDNYPVGLHVDEVKIGWNALSIFKTGFDDHLKLLPIYYDSFGDFRPTAIFYSTIPSILAFGKTIFAIRFPSALIGGLTIFPIYFLANSLIKDKDPSSKKSRVGYLAAFLIAISPWHIEVSRATSEVVMSTFFAIFSLYFLINLLKTGRIKFFFLTTIFISISYLFYHTIRLLAPLFFISILFFYFDEFKKSSIKKIITASIAFTFLLSIYFAVTSEGQKRFSQVSIFKDIDVIYEIERIKSDNIKPNPLSYIFDRKEVIYTKHFILEYSNYFSSNFLLGYSARPYRYVAPGTGLLNYVEVIFLLVGLFVILKGRANQSIILMLLLSPIAAAITSEDAPNLHRALIMIPFITIIGAYGLERLLNITKKYSYIIRPGIFLLVVLNSLFFFNMYFNHSQSHKPFFKDFFVDSPTYRNVGTIELIQKVDMLSSKYDKIIITNFPDSPYPWYAYFTNKDPKEFNLNYSQTTNERIYKNIIFSENKCPSDYAFEKYTEKNILVINSWECGHLSQIKAGLPAKVFETVTRKDGSEVFALLERDPEVAKTVKRTLIKR